MSPLKAPEFDPEEWVDQHGDLLFSFALPRVRNRDIAADLVQETFLAGIKGLDSFKGQSSIRTWLVGILKNKIIDHYRKSSREITSDLPFETDRPFLEAGEWRGHWNDGAGPQKWSEPSKAAELNELRQKLQTCIDDLPARLAHLYTMREIDAMSTEEICNRMDVTATNLGVLMHRARAQLRRCLENYWSH